MFESIYVADASHALTYEYLVFPQAPAFSEVGAVIMARLRDLPTTLQQIHQIPLNLEYFICTYSTPSIVICLLCLSGDKENVSNPLFPNRFLQKLVRASEDYFGTPLAPAKLSANSDTLTLLINEMIVNGMPHVTETNNLKNLVLLKSLLSTIIKAGNQLASAATHKTLSSLSAGPVSSVSSESDEIPWRKSNVKYTNNEMFVDVVESVNAILRPTKKKNKLKLLSNSNFDSAFYSSSTLPTSTKLAPVTRTITGSIEFISHISGVPQLQILFNSAAANMEAVLLHRCINSDTWKTSRALSFIPPDGNSTLLDYTIDLDKTQGKNSANGLGALDFDCDTGLGTQQNEFEFHIFTLNVQGVSKIEQIKVVVFAYEPIGSEDAADGTTGQNEENRLNAISDIKCTRATDGDFIYKGDGEGEWTVKNLQSGDHCLLRGQIRLFNDQNVNGPQLSSKEDLLEIEDHKVEHRKPLVPTHFQVSYLYKGQVPSGLKVDSLKLISAKGLGESVKPYKGVKYITKTGNFTVRTI